VTFLQLILFANTAAFFCSLLRFVSHSFQEGDSGHEFSTRWRWFKKINHLREILGFFKEMMDGLQTGFSWF